MKLTPKEYEQLKAIKTLYSWAEKLGRNKNGDLYCYSLEPCRMSKICWSIQYENGNADELREDVFASITYDKPLEIEKALESRGYDKWIAWDYPDEDVYECSACGNPFILLDGTPKENHYNFCPMCGRRLEGGE